MECIFSISVNVSTRDVYVDLIVQCFRQMTVIVHTSIIRYCIKDRDISTWSHDNFHPMAWILCRGFYYA